MAIKDLLGALFVVDETTEAPASRRRPTAASPEEEAKIVRRVGSLSTPELKGHFDQTINEIGVQMDRFFKDWDRSHLDMIDISLPVLVELRDEIENRYESQIVETVETAGIARSAPGKTDGM